MEQSQARTWRQAGAVALSRGVEQILQVIEQRGRSMHFADVLLKLEKRFPAKYRLDFLKHVTAIHSQEHRPLAGAVRHSQLDPHQETVELRLWKRKGADLVLWILRRDDEERVGQFVGHAVSGDSVFLHRFEERALRFGRRAVYLINQHDLRKERPAMKHETLFIPIEDGIAENVGRKEIAGE